jgi:protein-arginine kinase activator protein McsA
MANITFHEFGVILDALIAAETRLRKAGLWGANLGDKIEAAQEILHKMAEREAMTCETCGDPLDSVSLEAGRMQCARCYGP